MIDTVESKSVSRAHVYDVESLAFEVVSGNARSCLFRKMHELTIDDEIILFGNDDDQ